MIALDTTNPVEFFKAACRLGPLSNLGDGARALALKGKWMRNIECSHNIQIGDPVFCAFQRRAGTVTDIVVIYRRAPNGHEYDGYAECLVSWNDGTTSQLQPEYLSLNRRIGG